MMIYIPQAWLQCPVISHPVCCQFLECHLLAGPEILLKTVTIKVIVSCNVNREQTAHIKHTHIQTHTLQNLMNHKFSIHWRH